MASYPALLSEHNIPERLTFVAPARPLHMILPTLGNAHHRHTSDRGRARRSAYERQIDRVLDLVDGHQDAGRLVEIEKGHGIRRRRQLVDLGELLYSPGAALPGWVRDARRKITAGLVWLADNDPRTLGWARRQSAARARRDKGATRVQLPRANWATFYVFRRAYDGVARLILTLYDWWHRFTAAPPRAERAALAGRPVPVSEVIPSPRSASTRPQAEKRPRATQHTPEEEATVQGLLGPGRAYFEALPMPRNVGGAP